MKRILCVLPLVCLCTGLVPAQTQMDSDEQTLRSSKLPTDTDGLIAFFEKRSLKEGQAKMLQELVRKLGSDVYRTREPAYRDLVLHGPMALPFLKSALASTDLETKRRTEKCIEEIEKTMQAEPIAAAARVLAARKPDRAVPVLFNFLPSIANDAFLEEEILTTVGKLTVHPGKVDPLLMNALDDPLSHRRAVAVYLLGRRGDAEHRAKLRSMLNDTDPVVARRVAEGLVGKRPAQALQDGLATDESLLRSEKIELTEAAVIKYFRDLTLTEKDQERLQGLVKNLGRLAYTRREAATKQLVLERTKAVPFLKAVEGSTSDLELKRRVESLLSTIRASTNTAVPVAAAHWLARPDSRAPAESIRALLGYVPFADDENVEDEVLTCLTLLSLRTTELDPALLQALKDPLANRRGAAAYVIGQVGTKADIAQARALLEDPHPVARLRAVQGMLAARDKSALAPLVQLVQQAPPGYLLRVEEALRRLAEDRGPGDPLDTDVASRQKAAKAWEQWLADHYTRIDLSNLNDRDAYLGLITVCEYDSQIGNINGQVWETNRGNQKRFTFAGVTGAMDAHTLPNGRVLVAENSANRVTERDSKGNILWTMPVPTNPICCQRLPNGNTFIASYQMLMEVRPDKSVVYQYTPPNFYCFGAHKGRNGNIAAVTAQGQVIELDSKTGQQVNSVQAMTQGNWCSVELLTNGNYLIASMSTNSVREIDRKGTEVWSKPFNNAFRATKLPNGNVLVCGMNTRQVAEMDRAGNIRWSVNTPGRPWSVHYR